MNIFGRICVNCTVAAVALLTMITAGILVWTSMT